LRLDRQEANTDGGTSQDVVLDVYDAIREVAVIAFVQYTPSGLWKPCKSHGRDTSSLAQAMHVLHQQDILSSGVDIPSLLGSTIAEQTVAGVDLPCR